MASALVCMLHPNGIVEMETLTRQKLLHTVETTGWIDDDFAKEVIPIIPMGKLIQPQDIADTILFLASEQAKMLTGQVIKVSGGHAL